MRTSVQPTSIGAYHEHHRTGQASQQQARILQFITHCGGDWSVGELAHVLKLEKSTVSARVNELLYDIHELVECPKRKDRISGILIRPVKLPPFQLRMF